MEDEADEGSEEKDASLFAGSDGSSPVVTSLLLLSPAASVGFLSVVAGAMGTKKFAPINGFAGGTVGDWKVFVNAPLVPPPPLLNVSTYL